jgi:periplasmic divalent cation tolerance protein
MVESNTAARIVLTTAASDEEAGRLAHALVEERLIACASIVPSVRSIYRWEGQIEDSTEALLVIKTSAEQLPAVQTRLLALHSYQTPEFLVLPVESGSAGYLDWLLASVRKS